MKKVLVVFLAICMFLSSPCYVYAKTPVKIKSITAEFPEAGKVSIAVNQKRTLFVKVRPENAEEKLVWKSSDSDIVKVSKSGVIQGVKQGKAEIICKAKSNKDIFVSYKVTVKKRKKSDYYSKKNMKIVKSDSVKYSYKRLCKDLKSLKAEYPYLMEYKSLGKTYDKRNIYEVIIGNKNAKRHITIQASMHAREYINSLLVMRQLESLCANYYTGRYKGKYYSELLDKTCLHIIPMVNPDGIEISINGPKGIKNKTLKNNIIKMCKKYGKGKKRFYTRWKANARGVDLNRNYKEGWYRKKYKAVKKPTNAMYKGKSPESEKETKIMIKQFKSVKPKVVISYHSVGSIIYTNFGQSYSLNKKNQSLYKAVKVLTHYKRASCDKYKFRAEPTYGGFVGHTNKTNTLTIETGRKEAPVKKKQFKRIWKENKYVLPAVMNWTIENK